MAVQQRRVSVPVQNCKVMVAGKHPIVVQSMTNTDTADVMSPVNQWNRSLEIHRPPHV